MKSIDPVPCLHVLASSGLDEGSGQVVTLSIAVAAGAFLMVLAKRIKIPGIVLLLFGGVSLGPQGWGFVNPDALGETLNVLVSLSVGLILFEGGLTLNLDGYRSAEKVIRKLLTLGVLITWVVGAFAIWIIYRFDVRYCLLAGSLIIVTGPTVIQPILKRIRLQWNLHHTLHWEGVLIDPIGVFAAVLAFEWVVGGAGEKALMFLGMRILGGLAIGYVGGEITAFLIKRKWIPEEMLNAFIVGAAVLIFGGTEGLISEGGLLSVTVAGLVVGIRQPAELKRIVEFKSIITDILIGFIFILLTARLEVEQFFDFGIKGYTLVAVVMCIVRPLSIIACTQGSGMSWREKTFLGWIAPRGVVAASMASLFTLSLASQQSFAHPEFLETFVYSVIICTVVLQGFSAAPLAYLLKVRQPEPQGWLFVGAHPVARAAAKFLQEVRKVPVALIDGNRRAVMDAEAEGLTAIFGDAREADDFINRPELREVGRMMAFTDNEDLNELLCKKWEGMFGKGRVYRWASIPNTSETATGTVLWSWMPKPSMIGSEIELGEAALTVLEGERLKTPGNLAAMLTANAREVLLDPGPESKLKSDRSATQTLYLQREADYLLNALNPKLVFRSSSGSKEACFEEMTRQIASMESRVQADKVLEELLEREEAMPTSLGNSVAVPHAKIPGLNHSICAIGLIPDGIQFNEDDAEPVRLIFMLFSPLEKPEMHLAVLGEVARLVADAEVRQQLIECEDLDEVMVLIRRYRRQHTPFADVRS